MRRLLALAAFLTLATPFAIDARAGESGSPTLVAAPKASEIILFESEAQVAALAKAGPTVVFFFASWCPNCQATISELNSRWAEVKPGLTLVIADYDREVALKTKYGVTYQDTFVQVAPDGLPVGIWNSGGVAGLNSNTQGL